MPALLLLPGDGIGPEVIAEARRMASALLPGLDIVEGVVGGASYDLHGEPLTPGTLALAREVDAVLMGAVGGPKWDGVPRAKRPEAGLLALRKGLDVFANLRPAMCFPALADASSLKREIVEGLDLMIVRELTSGVYFGEPRGIEEAAGGREARGFDTAVYTRSEIERVARVAHTVAAGRRGEVCSVEKSNVMESGLFWRRTVQNLWESEGWQSNVRLSHMYADACAMELVRNPKRFDVILADNLFGDILSDEAAMLTGSIGMLPSAALGVSGTPGLYEPVHGSAPDIAGRSMANPCAAILSLEMALRFSFGRPDAAGHLRQAVEGALGSGAGTPDIGGRLSTREMGDNILARL